MRLAVIVPALNEDAAIVQALARLAPLRKRRVIGSWSTGQPRHTALLATPYADCVLQSEQGRALQMNAGANQHSIAASIRSSSCMLDCILRTCRG